MGNSDKEALDLTVHAMANTATALLSLIEATRRQIDETTYLKLFALCLIMKEQFDKLRGEIEHLPEEKSK